MPEHSQGDHIFKVETPLGKDVLLLEAFAGQEAISSTFHFTLHLLSEDEALDPNALLRENVAISIQMPDGSDRFIHGKVIRFSQRGQSTHFTEYEAEIVPWLWFLSLSTDCRVFQNMTVLEIIDEVFKAYPDADYEVKCLETYAPRQYCVQYRESDLNFVSRLLEEEGIHYFFEHTASAHSLVLGDHPDTIPKCAQPTAHVDTDPRGWQGIDVITGFQREHSVHTTAVTLNDYDYLQPSLNLRSSASTDSLEEVYEYPGQYSDLSDGERYANLLLKERSALRESVVGSSTCRGFQSGHQFELKEYYRKDANQPYLLISVSHRASGSGYVPDHEAADYSNTFLCTPMKVPFIPERRSPKPSVLGSQTAVVVGPAGEEIYTDPHGRVKVQFPWDREGEKDENSSCWVRVSQPWAGKGWGGVTIPRIGQEVIVDFLEGDPDRPIITGRVYNAEQIPPYPLPANKTQTGIKSRSSKGGDTSTFNEIRLEDKKGDELFYVHAEKDKKVVVENDRDESVGNNETIAIGTDRTEQVGNDESVRIGRDQRLKVGKDRKVSVGKDLNLAVGKDRSEEIGANHREVVRKNVQIEVGDDLTVSVGGDDSSTAGRNHEVEAGKDFTVGAKKKILIDGGDQITLKSGAASITLKKSGDITIKGKKINVKGSGDVVIKGAKIVEN